MNTEYWCPTEGDLVEVDGEPPDFCPYCGDITGTHPRGTA